MIASRPDPTRRSGGNLSLGFSRSVSSLIVNNATEGGMVWNLLPRKYNRSSFTHLAIYDIALVSLSRSSLSFSYPSAFSLSFLPSVHFPFLFLSFLVLYLVRQVSHFVETKVQYFQVNQIADLVRDRSNQLIGLQSQLDQ